MQLNYRFKILIVVFILLATMAQTTTSYCDGEVSDDTTQKTACKSEFPDLINDICWDCMFPLRIGGSVIISPSHTMFDNVPGQTLNTDDFNPSQVACACEKDGVYSYGIYISFWEPARILEVRHDQGCFAFLFGMDMSDATQAPRGSKGRSAVEPLQKSFQHVHYYSAPLLRILEIMDLSDFCLDKYFSGLDLAHMSELDPIWNDDEMTVLISPEAALFANPIGTALCAIGDCLPATLTYPVNALFWCSGCIGGLYPMTGNTGLVASPVATTSLLANRMLARLARMPLPPAIEMDTSSMTAKCEPQIRPFIKKSQYRFTMVTPVPETTSYHALGASPAAWGEFRNIPATGENHTYLVWRKRNCCLKLGDTE